MSSERAQVIHERELEWTETVRGERFAIRRKKLGAAAGSRELGCSLMEIPPGWRSWPYHFHHGNEEAIYILEGKGDLRLDGRKVPVAAGTYVSLLRGPGSAHQLHNTSDAPLRFLVFSTMNHPDITEYPDSNKLGLFAGSAPGGSAEERVLTRYVPEGAEVDYWDGEA